MELRLGRVRELVAHPTFRETPLRVAWRAVRWAGHCLLRRPAVVRFRDPDFVLALPPVWSGGGASSAFIWRERREPQLLLLKRLLEPGMVVLEGGASTGSCTVTAAVLVGPAGRVIAFEPGERSRACLERSKTLNRFDHVTIRGEALADRTGRTRLYRHHGRDVAFSFASPAGGEVEWIEVETMAIDEALGREGLDRLDFLKLEIEGAEELALRGSAALFARQRPTILFTINSDALSRAGLTLEGSVELLRGLGYTMYLLVEDRLVELERAPEGYHHVLAVHPERGLPDRIPVRGREGES